MVVTNASPIIWLSQVEQFHLLNEMFDAVAISPAVYEETVIRATGYPNAIHVQHACETGWMRVITPTDAVKIAMLRTHLHVGEAETLTLAEELQAELVIVDDLHARHFAKNMNLKLIGTAGLLLLAHRRGRPVDVRAVLDRMRILGFRINDRVY